MTREQAYTLIFDHPKALTLLKSVHEDEIIDLPISIQGEVIALRPYIIPGKPLKYYKNIIHSWLPEYTREDIYKIVDIYAKKLAVTCETVINYKGDQIYMKFKSLNTNDYYLKAVGEDYTDLYLQLTKYLEDYGEVK